jgi:hypothetical protein
MTMEEHVEIQVQAMMQFTLRVPKNAALEMDHESIAETIAEVMTEMTVQPVELYDSSGSIQDAKGVISITPQFDMVNVEDYEIVSIDHEDWPLVGDDDSE